jgi:predicted Zn-dependent peptidase
MEKIIINGLKEEVYYEKLPSGLDVYLWKNEKVNSFFASLNVNYGSIHTEFKLKKDKKIYQVPNGIAHFLEHVNFNIKGGTAYDIFDKLGSDINAFTTFEYTSYHLTGANDLEANLNNLLDYVYTPYFTKQLINNEKGIIIEEARAGLDNPGNIAFYKKLENTLYNDKRKNKVVGNLEDIKSITLEDIKLVYDTFYHPENMFMIVTGNIDIYATLACIKENMAKKEFKKYQYPEIIRKKEPSKVVKKYEEITGNVEIPLISVNLKVPQSKVGTDTENNILLSLILRCNFGASSEFKNDLLEQKLVTALSFSRSLVDDNILISIEASTKYPEEVVKLIKEKLQNMTITKEDFERKKRASIANLVFLYDDAEEVNMNIQDDIIYSNDHKIINNIKEIYENLKYEEALEQLKKIDLTNISVGIMKPKKEIE